MNDSDPNFCRRRFLRSSFAAVAAGSVAGRVAAASSVAGGLVAGSSVVTDSVSASDGLGLALGADAASSVAPAPKPLKLLILGGTAFLGPHLIDAAKARGHEITLFNRGRTNAHLFPDLEKLRGDRDPNKGDGLKSLQGAVDGGRKWDVVIDTSAYYPRVVSAAASLLAKATNHYQLISTLSVFADRSVDVDESAPVAQLPDPATEKVTGATYGGLKALCEAAAEATMPGRVSNVRPGLIVGPLDRSDRFTWWPERIARGGEILSPGKPDAPIQVIDVRDLAAWCIQVVEQKTVGVFNAVGPASRVTMQEFLHGCKIVLGADATFTWLPDAFLLEEKVGPYVEIPLWLPRDPAPYGTAICQKSIAAGLTFRPTGDTIRDTFAWANTRATDHRWRAGLAAEKESAILKKWHQQNEK